MRMGIGIGWPNASAQATPIVSRTGWFNIYVDCGGTEYISAWSQLLTDTNLQSGQYAYSPNIGTRVLLGTFSETEPLVLFRILIENEGFNSCEV